MLTQYKITIDETDYIWEHDSCHCFGHCNADRFYVDGEFYGKIDNPALCRLMIDMIAMIDASQIRKTDEIMTSEKYQSNLEELYREFEANYPRWRDMLDEILLEHQKSAKRTAHDKTQT